MKMIVRKEQSRTFYEYLKLIYDMLATETSGYALYIHEGRLYFTTYTIGEELSISSSGVEVYDELCRELGAYEMRMTPHRDFEVSKLPESRVTEDMKNIFRHTAIGLEEKNHLCEINSSCSSMTADTTRESELRTEDRYLKMMKKLQDSDVSMNKDFIICTKAEAPDKENLQVVLIMYFWCGNIQDEYDRDKLGMDQKVEQMLIRIIKELRDLPKHKQPMQGKVCGTLDQISGRYNAQRDCRKIIIVDGYKMSVHREKYEPIQKIRRRKSGGEG